MRIPERLATGPCFSFEFFPPKTKEGEAQLFDTVRDLAVLEPGFVSVTYGAGGSSREETIEVVSRLKNETRIEPLAHLAVRGHTTDEVRTILNRLQAGKIENVLCLRGDMPKHGSDTTERVGDFRYASDLIAFARAHHPVLTLGAACYPEKHVESVSWTDDLFAAKLKVELGAEFLITQLFFDNTDYVRFVSTAREMGIRVPIIPGIMPITNAKQVERFAEMCGVRIPDELRAALIACDGDQEKVMRLGIAHATRQCRDLVAQGAPGVHFYTLNRSRATRAIVEQLRKEGV